MDGLIVVLSLFATALALIYALTYRRRIQRLERQLQSAGYSLGAITAERDRANQERQDLHSLLHIAGDTAPVMLALCRLQDLGIRYANRTWRDTFPETGGEQQTTSPGAIFAVADDRVKFMRALRDGGRVEGMVARLNANQPTEQWGLVSAERLTYRDEDAVMVVIADVSAQVRMEREQSEQTDLLEAVFETAPIELSISRLRDRTVLKANRRWQETVGMTVEEANRQPPSRFFIDSEDYKRIGEALLRDGYFFNYEMQLRSVLCNDFWGLVSGTLVSYRGEPAAILSVTDITFQKRLESELERLAATDELTALCNRRHFMERGAAEFDRARRYGSPLSVLMFDLDHFKQVNDRYGHATGDRALRAVAKVAAATFRTIDIAGRLGGEEFGVILPETTVPDAVGAAERFRAQVAALDIHDEEGRRVPLTVSIGVVQVEAYDRSFEQGLGRADVLLYEAKRAGRNRVMHQLPAINSEPNTRSVLPSV